MKNSIISFSQIPFFSPHRCRCVFSFALLLFTCDVIVINGFCTEVETRMQDTLEIRVLMQYDFRGICLNLIFFNKKLIAISE